MGDTATLKAEGERLGRAGLAERVLQLVKEFAADGSYKAAIELAGRMHAIAIACKYDDYWQEKAETGYRRELFDLRNITTPHPGDHP
jgi:hypothetical protein